MIPHEEIAEFIAGSVDAAKLTQLRPSAAAEARVVELVEKKKDGILRPEEETELEGFLWTEHLMILAKAKARAHAAGA